MGNVLDALWSCHSDSTVSEQSDCFFHVTAEVLDLETNEGVNNTYHSMQMPKVEYETITIDDYSRYHASHESAGSGS